MIRYYYCTEAGPTQITLGFNALDQRKFRRFGFQMGILPMCILLALLLAVNFCHGDDSKTVEVVGSAEFALSNIKRSEAFSGLRVTIDCKPENGNGWSKTRGIGELYVEGKFKVPLLEEIVEDGKLKPTFGWAKNRKLKFSSPICAAVSYYTLPLPPRPPVPSPPVRIAFDYVPAPVVSTYEHRKPQQRKSQK